MTDEKSKDVLIKGGYVPPDINAALKVGGKEPATKGMVPPSLPKLPASPQAVSQTGTSGGTQSGGTNQSGNTDKG